MILTLALLLGAMPRATEANAALHCASLAEGTERWEINTAARLAAFFAQIGHESADLSRTEENLNYSAEALRRVWPTRFPTDQLARQYARKPSAIANLVYSGRLGNGQTMTGDGWTYRGRGCLGVTGRANYAAYGPIGIEMPDALARPPHAALSACWFWGTRNLNVLADYDGEEAVKTVTRRINGALLGIEDRLARWRIARDAVRGMAA